MGKKSVIFLRILPQERVFFQRLARQNAINPEIFSEHSGNFLRLNRQNLQELSEVFAENAQTLPKIYALKRRFLSLFERAGT